jgi:nucleoside-diphosphate-sugar epimerase
LIILDTQNTLPITNYGKSKNILREFLFSLKTKYKYNLTWARIFYMYGVNDKRETLTNILINSQKNQKYVVLNKNIKRDYFDVKEADKKISELLKQL